MNVRVKPWDAADHLDSKEAVLAYIEAAFEDGDAELIAAVLDDIARAKGVAGREPLTADTSIAGVVRTLKALGLELAARAA